MVGSTPEPSLSSTSSNATAEVGLSDGLAFAPAPLGEPLRRSSTIMWAKDVPKLIVINTCTTTRHLILCVCRESKSNKGE